MISFEPEKLWAQLRLHEGVRQKPYVDTVGKLTVGVGRNLTDRGLSEDEIDLLLRNDIAIVCDGLDKVFPAWRSLSSARQRVLIDLCFNVGVGKFMTFSKMLDAIKSSQWDIAANEMLNSRWASQVGQRAKTLSGMMKDG